MDYLYKNWAHIGGVSVFFFFWLLFFNSKAEIGSYKWLFWLIMPFYFIHQFEEYVFPGKFKETINSFLTKQNDIDFPLNDKIAFYINTVFATWILLPILIILADFSIWFPLIFVVLTIVNSLLHIVVSIRLRSYKPGLFASIFLNLPLGIYILYVVTLESLVIPSDLLIILILGFILHWLVVLPVFLNLALNKGKIITSSRG